MTRQGSIFATELPMAANKVTDAVAVAMEPDILDYDARMVPFGNSAWIACEVIHLTCVIVALYLLYALLHYRALKMMHPRIAERHRKGGVWLENLCIIAILFALVRFAINQALLFTGFMSGSRCSVLINVSIAMYFVTVHPIYLFLWVRQRIFYANRALKHLYSKTVRFLSWAALLCFISVTIVSMVIFVVDPQNSASGRVCHYSLLEGKTDEEKYSNGSLPEGDGGRRQGVIVNTLAGLLGGGIQMSFLALFLYPIMDNKLRAVRSKHLRSGSVGLLTLIRRSFVLAGLCIFSDVAIALLVKTVYNSFPSAAFAPLAMYDINLIINIICIIMTFRRWRVMLFPWLYTDTCRGLFDWLGNCSRRIRPGTSGVYDINKPRPPIRRLFSVESTSNMERSAVSSIRYKANRREATQAVQVVPNPVPDVLLPMMESHVCVERPPEKETWYTESLLANLNQNIDQDLQNYSDSVLQIARPEFERKRSSSLVIQTSRSESFKQTNAKVAATLLAKSKMWIFDGKHL